MSAAWKIEDLGVRAHDGVDIANKLAARGNGVHYGPKVGFKKQRRGFEIVGLASGRKRDSKPLVTQAEANVRRLQTPPEKESRGLCQCAGQTMMKYEQL